MRVDFRFIILVGPLFLIFGCGQSDKPSAFMEKKNTYSLCPKTGDARQRLIRQIGLFADQQKAQIIDRSSEVQQELYDLRSDVLNKTGGQPILITVKKAGEFRVSVTNLGLKEKMVLSVTRMGEPGSDIAIDGLIHEFGPFWTMEEVDGGITNDPSC